MGGGGVGYFACTMKPGGRSFSNEEGTMGTKLRIQSETLAWRWWEKTEKLFQEGRGEKGGSLCYVLIHIPEE